jgi:RNA polymerase sigma factor (sigma-70 family)
MTPEAFEVLAQSLRPRLHRYGARMMGSAVEGEDCVQEALLKALVALGAGSVVESPEGWLFRILHRVCLDLLRAKSRQRLVALSEADEPSLSAAPDMLSVGFRTFLRLPELQRCAVILRDVLGHSIAEIAAIAGCSPGAAKAALQRGRVTLRKLAAAPEDLRLPVMSAQARAQMQDYVGLFRAGDFDAIRAMLAEDVRLELVNRLRLEGREKTAVYFGRYAAAPKWRFGMGAVEGGPAMLVFDEAGQLSHFVLIDWRGGAIGTIRDYLFAGYVLEGLDWVAL